jgi:hypothetical protein
LIAEREDGQDSSKLQSADKTGKVVARTSELGSDALEAFKNFLANREAFERFLALGPSPQANSVSSLLSFFGDMQGPVSFRLTRHTLPLTYIWKHWFYQGCKKERRDLTSEKS